MNPDLMLTVSSVGFALALLPAVYDSFRGRTTITLLASVPTALLLGNTAWALLLLDQQVSPWTTLVGAALWVVLAVNRWR